MNKYKRLGKNTLLVFVGNIGSKLILFLLLPFYTKWLTVEEYGVTDLITIYATFLLGIVTACLAESIFIFPKDKDKKIQKEYFSTGLYFALISFIISAFLFFLVDMAFSYFQFNSSISNYTWWIFWIIVATFLQTYMQQFSRSIDKVAVYAISGIVLTSSTAVLSFLLIPQYGVLGFVLSQVISLFLGALYTFFHSKSYTFFKITSINKNRGIEMLKYSIPLIPNGIMWMVVGGLNRPVLEHYYGMNDVGLFAVASKFPAILVIVVSVFMFSWQISVIEEFKKPSYKAFYNKMLRIIFLVLLILSCGVAIFSKTIIAIVVDDKFLESWRLLPLLVFAVLFSFLSAFVGANFSATKESKYYFYSSLWGALASILFNILLVPYYGLYGAAMAVVLSYGIMAISRIKYSWKLVQITNIPIYLIMLFVNIIVILTVFYIDSMLLKWTIYIGLFFITLRINKEVFLDIKKNIINFRNKKTDGI